MSNVSSEVESSSEHHYQHRIALEEVRKQLTGFGNQMLEYFDQIEAEVENYKFNVEKHGEGVEVDLQFKVYVHPKAVNVAKTITM